MRIETWKKLITIVGFLTLEIGHAMDSKILIIIGAVSTLIGMVFILLK